MSVSCVLSVSTDATRPNQPVFVTATFSGASANVTVAEIIPITGAAANGQTNVGELVGLEIPASTTVEATWVMVFPDTGIPLVYGTETTFLLSDGTRVTPSNNPTVTVIPVVLPLVSGPTDGFLLEDGVSFLMLEDGTSYLLQES